MGQDENDPKQKLCKIGRIRATKNSLPSFKRRR
jgi:hypothetical protein